MELSYNRESELHASPQCSGATQLSTTGCSTAEHTPIENVSSIFQLPQMLPEGFPAQGYTPTPLFYQLNGSLQQLYIFQNFSQIPNHASYPCGEATINNINCVSTNESLGGALEIPSSDNGFINTSGNITEKYEFPEKPANSQPRHTVRNGIFTQEIRQKLDLHFSVRMYLSPSQAHTIADQVGITTKQVFRYFQQKRKNATARQKRAMNKTATQNKSSDGKTLK